MPAVHAAAVHQHAVQAEQVAHAAVRIRRQEAPVARVQVQLVWELVAVVDLRGARARDFQRAPPWLSTTLWLAGSGDGYSAGIMAEQQGTFPTNIRAWSFAQCMQRLVDDCKRSSA